MNERLDGSVIAFYLIKHFRIVSVSYVSGVVVYKLIDTDDSMVLGEGIGTLCVLVKLMEQPRGSFLHRGSRQT